MGFAVLVFFGLVVEGAKHFFEFTISTHQRNVIVVPDVCDCEQGGTERLAIKTIEGVRVLGNDEHALFRKGLAVCNLDFGDF